MFTSNDKTRQVKDRKKLKKVSITEGYLRAEDFVRHGLRTATCLRKFEPLNTGAKPSQSPLRLWEAENGKTNRDREAGWNQR